MGALNSNQKKNTQGEVNMGTTKEFFVGSVRSCSKNSFVDNNTLISSFSNDRATGEMDDNPPDEKYQASGSSSKLKYLPYSKGGFTNDIYLVPSDSNQKRITNDIYLVPSDSYQKRRNSQIRGNCWSTLSTNWTATYQSYEPTPLTEVLPRLYLGSREDADQKEKITSLGITHIISVSGGELHKDLCAKYMYIPLRDDGSSDLLGSLKNSYDFMVESQEPDNKLFIHCEWGQNRSPSFVIGFLMRYKRWSLHEAYTFLKEKREVIHPHKKYLIQLRRLDKELHGVFSTPESFLDIELSSQEGIKIRHHDFDKKASHAYIEKQEALKVAKKAKLTGSM